MNSGDPEHKGIMTKIKEKLHLGGHKEEEVDAHGHHGAQTGTAPVVGSSAPATTKTTVPTTGAQATNMAGAHTTGAASAKPGATTNVAGATTTKPGAATAAAAGAPGSGTVTHATGVYAGDKSGAAVPTAHSAAGFVPGQGHTGATTTGTRTGAVGTGTGTVGTTTTGAMHTSQGGATHHVSDTHEKGMHATDPTARAAPHWNRAEEEIRLAKAEAASVNARSKEAYDLAEKVSYFQAESENARRTYEENAKRLRDLEGNVVAEADIGKQAGAAKAAATAKARAADDQIKEAERAAEIARLRYKEAKEQLEKAEQARLVYAQLSREAAEKNRLVEEAERRAQAMHNEGRSLEATLEEKRDTHGRLVNELEEHTALVDQKARELAEAQALANQKAHALHGMQDSLRNVEAAATAKLAEAQRLGQEAEASRASIVQLQERLGRAREDAFLARQLADQSVDIATAERERAIGAKAAADRAAAESEALAQVARNKLRELEEARRQNKLNAEQMATLQREAETAQAQADKSYAEAEHRTKEWTQVKEELKVHHGNWHDHWERAKREGQLGDEEATRAFERQLGEIERQFPNMGQAAKNVGPGGDMSHNVTATSSRDDTVGHSATGANAPQRVAQGMQ